MKEKKPISVNICYLLEQKKWTLTKLSTEIKKIIRDDKRRGKSMFSEYASGGNMRSYMFFVVCRALEVDPDTMIKPVTEIKEYKKWDNFPSSLEEYKKQLQKVLGSQIKAGNMEAFIEQFESNASQLGADQDDGEISNATYYRYSEKMGNISIGRLLILSRCFGISLKQVAGLE